MTGTGPMCGGGPCLAGWLCSPAGCYDPNVAYGQDRYLKRRRAAGYAGLEPEGTTGYFFLLAFEGIRTHFSNPI